MDPEYGARYRDLYERHWWWRSREAMVLDLLERFAPAERDGDILDVGCGDGLLLAKLHRFGRPRGLEPEAALLVTPPAERPAPIDVCYLDADYRPERPLALVTMLDVLEHIENDREALGHLHRILRPGGVAVLTVPALRWLWTRHDTLNHHHRRYHRGELTDRLRDAGFDVEICRYAYHWLVPLKLAIRLKEGLRAGAPTPPSVPAAPINTAFRCLSSAERRLPSRLRPPWGTSLVAVARRR
ncbi:MAG: class I SAM-dependent methyltransferase [Acidobacteriota bacterium]